MRGEAVDVKSHVSDRVGGDNKRLGEWRYMGSWLAGKVESQAGARRMERLTVCHSKFDPCCSDNYSTLVKWMSKRNGTGLPRRRIGAVITQGACYSLRGPIMRRLLNILAMQCTDNL